MGDDRDVDSIYVDYVGEVFSLGSEDQLMFGRGNGADLNIDDDNHDLHRRFGRIWHKDNHWWLGNEGTRLPMSMHDLSSASFSTLAPNTVAAVTFTKAAVRFVAGATNYEILITGNRPATAVEPVGPDRESSGIDAETVDRSKIPVVGGQRLLLVALAEQKLKNPHEPIALPTNKEICRRLGWTATSFNRKLDRLCAKFAHAGVTGLVGDIGKHAAERRRRLVEYTVKFGVVTATDLTLLEDYPTV